MYLDIYVVASLIGVVAMIAGSVWAVVKVKELVARDAGES